MEGWKYFDRRSVAKVGGRLKVAFVPTPPASCVLRPASCFLRPASCFLLPATLPHAFGVTVSAFSTAAVFNLLPRLSLAMREYTDNLGSKRNLNSRIVYEV